MLFPDHCDAADGHETDNKGAELSPAHFFKPALGNPVRARRAKACAQTVKKYLHIQCAQCRIGADFHQLHDKGIYRLCGDQRLPAQNPSWPALKFFKALNPHQMMLFMCLENGVMKCAPQSPWTMSLLPRLRNIRA